MVPTLCLRTAVSTIATYGPTVAPFLPQSVGDLTKGIRKQEDAKGSTVSSKAFQLRKQLPCVACCDRTEHSLTSSVGLSVPLSSRPMLPCFLSPSWSEITILARRIQGSKGLGSSTPGRKNPEEKLQGSPMAKQTWMLGPGPIRTNLWTILLAEVFSSDQSPVTPPCF
jgi:hypothetical protein